MTKQNWNRKLTAAYPFQRKGIWKAAYFGAGIVAIGALLLAPKWNQAVCMAASTAGILLMGILNAVLGYRSCGRKYFISRSFIKDAGILIIWVILMMIWHSELTGRIGV